MISVSKWFPVIAVALSPALASCEVFRWHHVPETYTEIGGFSGNEIVRKFYRETSNGRTDEEVFIDVILAEKKRTDSEDVSQLLKENNFKCKNSICIFNELSYNERPKISRELDETFTIITWAVSMMAGDNGLIMKASVISTSYKGE